MNLLELIRKIWRYPKRILVLGTRLASDVVDSYNWDYLPRDINIADYDVLILNLVSLSKSKKGQREYVNQSALPPSEQLVRLLLSEGSEIIVIGNPDLRVANDLGYETHRFTEGWLPYFPESAIKFGETIRDVEKEFAFYFRYVKRWSFCFDMKGTISDTKSSMREYNKIIDTGMEWFEKDVVPIAQTRLKDAVGLKLKFVFGVYNSYYSPNLANDPNLARFFPDPAQRKLHSTPSFTVAESGVVIWLPESTAMDSSNAVNLILKRRYGISSKKAPRALIAKPSTSTLESKTIGQTEEIIAPLKPSPTLFISYSRQDSEIVQRLSNDLKEHGINTWIDESSIRGGEDWEERILEAIEVSAAVLAILSPNAFKSDWVRNELVFAHENSKPIIPIIYQSCELPKWYGFRFVRVHRVDFSQGNYRENVVKLINAIKRVLDS
jgi:hypothetical protein